MALYKTGVDRDQLVLVPTCLDDIIDQDNVARVIDSFVDSLDTSSFKYGNISSSPGNKPFNPKDLLKIYLLGYFYGIRSSRKLMHQTRVNIEFIWLIKGLTPDFRTISDFRKDNISLLKGILFDFNLACQKLNLFSGIGSLDGTKLKAVNSKDNNFTLSKIDDRISLVKQHIDQFITDLDSTDNLDDKLELQNSLVSAQNKLALLESYSKNMRDNDKSQLSLTDPDSKLMRDNGKFTVAYNNQACFDVNSHLLYDFQITNNPSDLGSIHSLSKEIKDTFSFDTFTNLTDKGYADRFDMINSLEDGIIPQVTPSNGNSSFTLETDYEDNSISDVDIKSTKCSDIKKCLRAGVIPDVYKDYISSIEVKNKNIYQYESIDSDNPDNYDEHQLRDIAINDLCFTRDLNTDKVFCPMGEILRRKSRNGNKVRYCNKLACKNCKNPCSASSFKVVEFSPHRIFVGKKVPRKKRIKDSKSIVKKVIITTNPNFALLKNRMATSEHPHGSMKFWDNAHFLLLKGFKKVTGEVALYYCAYNIRCAINILGAKALIAYFKEGIIPSYPDNSFFIDNINVNICKFFRSFYFCYSFFY